MKKFLSFLLTFVMLFSLTMPAMAAEVDGDTSSDVTASYTPTDTTAKITGVSITVDGTPYTTGNVTITPDSTVTLTVTGINLKNGTSDNIVIYSASYGGYVTTDFFTISDDGATATSPIKANTYEYNTNYEIVYYNDYTTDKTAVGTGIYVTYNEGTKPVTYTVTIGETTNGTVTADKTTAVEGDTITLTITPDAQYKMGTITVTDAEGNPVTVTDKTFVMPASNVTVTVTFEQMSISSVEITWGSMTFTYSDEQVAQDDGSTADKGWSDSGTGWVTVKNTGNTTLTAQAKYESYEGYAEITGSFDPASKELAPESSYTFNLELRGKPAKALSGEKIGKVTITINDAAEG